MQVDLAMCILIYRTDEIWQCQVLSQSSSWYLKVLRMMMIVIEMIRFWWWLCEPRWFKSLLHKKIFFDFVVTCTHNDTWSFAVKCVASTLPDKVAGGELIAYLHMLKWNNKVTETLLTAARAVFRHRKENEVCDVLKILLIQFMEMWPKNTFL